MSEATALIELGKKLDADLFAATVRCSACDYRVSTLYRPRYGALDEYAQLYLADHLAQHLPGRALDIEVDWVPRAFCSVCDDGLGNIDQKNDGLVCRACGTTWGIDGMDGYRKEASNA